MEPWKPLSFKEFDALEKEPLDRKVERAVAVIREAVNLSKHQMAVAFSGGVDSAYLLYAALQSGADVRAYYVKSAFQPQFELDDARRLAGAGELPCRSAPAPRFRRLPHDRERPVVEKRRGPLPRLRF